MWEWLFGVPEVRSGINKNEETQMDAANIDNPEAQRRALQRMKTAPPASMRNQPSPEMQRMLDEKKRLLEEELNKKFPLK